MLLFRKSYKFVEKCVIGIIAIINSTKTDCYYSDDDVYYIQLEYLVVIKWNI